MDQIANIAVLDFEPWDRSTAPSDEDITSAADDNMIAARLAYSIMFRTKAELIDFARDEPEAFMGIADAIGDAAKAFAGMAEMVEGACARMLTAASAHVAAQEVSA